MANLSVSRTPENGAKTANIGRGPKLAHNLHYVIEISSSDGLPANPKATWGGARNRADRESRCLSLASASGVIAAVRHALAIGLPLNRHLTIHWEHAGLTDGQAAAATGAYLDRTRRLFDKLGYRFARCWIRENDGGIGQKGSHVHILIHVPTGAGPHLAAMQRRWISDVTGQPYVRGTLLTARIGGRANTWASDPASYHVNLLKVVHYVLKATEPGAAQTLGLSHAPEYGRVIGKRAGWSENIGAVARRRHDAGEGIGKNGAIYRGRGRRALHIRVSEAAAKGSK